MNKPKWEDAPEWAEYLAMDSDGVWIWYKYKPSPSTEDSFWSVKKGPFAVAQDKPGEWKNTLEKRPS